MTTLSKVGSGAYVSASDVDSVYVVRNRVALSGVANADVVESLAIPAGTLVLAVMTNVITAEGSGACSATVGDASGAASWDGSVDLAATAGTKTTTVFGTDAYGTSGKLYTAADTIDLTMTVASGPCTTGVFEIAALCVKPW